MIIRGNSWSFVLKIKIQPFFFLIPRPQEFFLYFFRKLRNHIIFHPNFASEI